MVMDQALWMSVTGRGDGQPPNKLWDAVVAEDWSSVHREWDRWMRPLLREMDSTGRDWRALAMTSVQMTVTWLKDAGVSSPVPPDASAPLGENAIMRLWLPWICKGITAVKDAARRHEWARFVDALPEELQALAVEHPERQAEVAACVFETEMITRALLDNDGEGG
jgi:hypothetical protein